MASSSPLLEPPSSPTRSPSRDGSRKCGSYDPTTPRTARRLRSVERGRKVPGRAQSVFDTVPKVAVPAQSVFSVGTAKTPVVDPFAIPPGGEGGKDKGKGMATPWTLKIAALWSHLRGHIQCPTFPTGYI